MKKKIPSAHKLPSGTWRCFLTINGKRYSFLGESKQEAQARAIAARAGITELEEERKHFLSLGDAVDEYIQDSTGILDSSTLRGYGTIRRNRFKDLMQRNVHTMTVDDVQDAIRVETQYVSPKTIKNAIGLIQPVLKKYGLDISGVKKPAIIKPKRTYMQPEELDAFFEAAADDPHGPAVILAVWSGMRRSEICGLCWDCIDFKRRTITIRYKVTPDQDGKMTLKPGAKNESSQRTIQCPDYIMDLLYHIRPLNPQPDQRVFPVHPDTLRKAAHRVSKKAGVTDSSLHALRHTNAAAMRFLGVSTHHAMERGGWTNENTFNRTYAYNFNEAMAEDNRKIDQFFDPNRGDKDE